MPAAAQELNIYELHIYETGNTKRNVATRATAA